LNAAPVSAGFRKRETGLPGYAEKESMKTITFYQNAHLFVAAIRVLEHQKKAPPLMEDVCRLLSFSLEQGHFICKKLEQMGIVEAVEGGYGLRLFIKNHLALEDLPKEGSQSRLEEALKEFKASKDVFQKKVASIKADQDKKKQSLFADLEKKLKQDMQKKK
jgi:hypothetical protein